MTGPHSREDGLQSAELADRSAVSGGLRVCAGAQVEHPEGSLRTPLLTFCLQDSKVGPVHAQKQALLPHWPALCDDSLFKTLFIY